MTPVELFQREHGAEWASLVRSPAFNAALLLVNAETVQAITTLSNEEIEERGKIILADLRGRLAHEAHLISLSVVQTGPLNDLPEATYPDPEDEAEEAADSQDSQTTGGSLEQWFASPKAGEEASKLQPRPTKAVKPKRRRKRRKRKTT